MRRLYDELCVSCRGLGRVTEKVTETAESKVRGEKKSVGGGAEGGGAVKWDYNSITEVSYICFSWTWSNHLGCPFVFWIATQA